MRFAWRRAAAFCMACLLLCLCACGSSAPNDPTATEPVSQPDAAQIRYNDLRLPYSRADSLDPFRAKSSLNRQLTTLLYDSLFTLGDSFEAKPLIASEYTTDSFSVLVTLNSDVRFTDGSVLSAQDVIYSFDLAKASDAYKARLRGVESAEIRGDNAVLFVLSAVDPYAVACLTFPIVKTGTSFADRKKQQAETTTEDGVDAAKTTEQVVPVGSGRYVLSYEAGEPDPVLTAFNERYKGFYPAMTVIHLVNVTDSSALFYSLEIGNLSFAFDDLSSGKYTRVNATISEYPMNSFVFLGMNQDDAGLANPQVRQAILASVDLENVLNVAFQGHAAVTHTPFNPMWTEANAYETVHAADKRQDAAAILKEAGFDKVNTYGILNNGRISLALDLIVSEGNEFKRMAAQQIAKNLSLLKIKVNITALPPEQFRNAVELGKFDLYIGEVNLSPNMNLSPFFGGSGALAHGIWSKTASDAYGQFLSGEINLDAFMEAFRLDVPFVPLCYRKGIAASVKELQGTQNANYADLYADIEDWHF